MDGACDFTIPLSSHSALKDNVGAHPCTLSSRPWQNGLIKRGSTNIERRLSGSRSARKVPAPARFNIALLEDLIAIGGSLFIVSRF